jgi:hypothetical protein
MSANATERTAVLVARAWLEGENHTDLKARITRTLDVEHLEGTVSSASTIDDVCETVRDWLEAFIAGAASQEWTSS